MLVRYPPTAEVQEDVSLGCHQGALLGPHPRRLACNLSYVRLRRYLAGVGTLFTVRLHNLRFRPTEQACVRAVSEAVLRMRTPGGGTHTSRDSHGDGRVIVRNSSGVYLNRFHRLLLANLGPPDMARAALLSIEKEAAEAQLPPGRRARPSRDATPLFLLEIRKPLREEQWLPDIAELAMCSPLNCGPQLHPDDEEHEEEDGIPRHAVSGRLGDAHPGDSDIDSEDEEPAEAVRPRVASDPGDRTPGKMVAIKIES